MFIEKETVNVTSKSNIGERDLLFIVHGHKSKRYEGKAPFKLSEKL